MERIQDGIKMSGKYAALFLIGGGVYFLLEVAWRGHSHWSMVIVGGICFVSCGLLNEVFEWQTPMWMQMLLSSLLITAAEFVSGCILNLWLGLEVWDYSGMPLNLFGQICLPFMILWFFLSVAAIILDDYLRYWLFGEEKPRYVWR